MQHQIVSREEWIAARRELLAREKEVTRMRDQLNVRRRELPWVKVEKSYVFGGPNGEETLADLFDGRSQLVVRHFMLGPGWEEGCVGCSFSADHIEGALVHLEHHDVTVVVISRAPLPEIEAFKRRMGWRFKWVSSYGSDFNYDYHVSFTPEDVATGKADYNYELTERAGEEMPGVSVFYKDVSGAIAHTYSAYARGTEALAGTYNFLDLTPKGRDETGPNHNLTDWVRHHDRYGVAGPVVCSKTESQSCCAEE
jgi:predicted dithiol-disulfide oxidoreductase (DUF899 family)